MIKIMKQMKPIFDGLESVREAICDLLAVQERNFAPYDEYTGTKQTPYGFTGEMEDDNRLVYLRARYYSRDFGAFISEDPFEGSPCKPLSLNRYAYAYGNPVNLTDPSDCIPVIVLKSNTILDELHWKKWRGVLRGYEILPRRVQALNWMNAIFGI